MKLSNLILTCLLGAGLTAQAEIYSLGTVDTPGTVLGALQTADILDGNPVGMWNTMDLTGLGLGNVSEISVTLNLSGGHNSGLYAYLSYDGMLVPLLNRIGVGSANAFGNTSSGLANITLDSTSSDVHLVSGTLAGTYQADGRGISPFSSAASFDAPGTLTLNGSFGGVNPNGTWTLFIADVVAGGGNATLNGWSLNIAAVPEPTTWALLGGGFLILATSRRCWRTKGG